jgi:hypothetical protein
VAGRRAEISSRQGVDRHLVEPNPAPVMAWAPITGDTRMVQQPLTQGQAADARANAKKHRDTARELDEGLETQV